MKVIELTVPTASHKREFYGGSHNHLPLSTPKLLPEKAHLIKTMLTHGAKPSQVHRKLVAESGSDQSSRTIATKGAIRQMKYRLQHSHYISSEAAANVVLLHGELGTQFLRVIVQYAPFYGIILCDNDGLKYLINEGRVVFIDGTHKVVQVNGVDMTLVTLMINHRGIGVPVAFYITNQASTESYSFFFKHMNEATGRQWKPVYIVTDYELALQNACRENFSETASVLGDSFHFLQANRRWLSQHHCPSIDTVVEQLRQLLVLPDKTSFDTQLQRYQSQWLQTMPDYAAYFRREWTEVHQTTTWALHSRRNAPSGDQLLEAWHNALKSALYKPQQDLDVVADFLHREWRYYFNIVSVPMLLEQRLKEVNTTNRTLQSVTIDNTTALSHNRNVEVVEIETNNGNVNLCLKCKKRNLNASCTLKYCKYCCIESASYCKVSSHNREIATRSEKPKFWAVISEALKPNSTSTTVWVKYSTGSTPGRVRKLSLIGWLVPNVSFKAYSDDNYEQDKAYHLNRIIDAREQPWLD